ncbi:MAG: Rne/Rng family ribonuclease [Deltaproteobacteria bacterium]|nr:Rne/Rng family ribonuclease [Deltaproteobacteria bacterium]
MTEKKGKRKYWRRRPRREEGEGTAPGGQPPEGHLPPPGEQAIQAEPPKEDREIPAASDVSGEAPDREEGAGAPREDDERGAPAPRQPGEPLTAPEVLEVAKAVSGEAAPAKSRRRRSRRRGKGAPAETAAETPAVPEEAAPRAEEEPALFPAEGATIPEPATREYQSGAAEEPREAPAAPEGTEEGRAPEAVAAEPRKGRRRSRRRGRRRGKGIAPAPEGEAVSEGAAAPEEFARGAEGTSSEEPAPAIEGEFAFEAEEEEEEEEAAAEAGKGPRKVMLIDGIHPEEIRVAFVSDGNLDYFEVENQRRKQFKGNIYKGKVVNVAQAIEAAFVEFGGGRHGFLPLNEYCAGALMEHLGTWNEGDKRPHLRPGTEILVQVTKEESSIKGAALTSYISIAGRYLVMMLGMKRYGISKKIAAEKEREKIRKNMEKLTYPENLGFIVRTVGAGQPLKNLKADLENLLKLWERTVAGARTQKAPALLYEEQDIVIRTLRDNYSSDVSEVLMNSADSYRKAQAFFDVYYPKQKQKLKLYRQKRPLFFKFNLEEQIEKACTRKVPLPSGGHIVIDRTEAMWSIDVNSGRSARDRDIEDTAYRTNKEAASEVARQLRIRDMGGLIVIDFIDMEHRGHIKDVEKTLKDTLKADKAKTDVSSMGKFGLVAVSRQRMGISFYDVLLKGCERCGGTGLLPTEDSVTVRLLRRVHSELSKDQAKELVVRVSPPLLETLLNQKREEVTSLERMCGYRVTFVSDPSLSAASFSVGEETT